MEGEVNSESIFSFSKMPILKPKLGVSGVKLYIFEVDCVQKEGANKEYKTLFQNTANGNLGFAFIIALASSEFQILPAASPARAVC